MSPKLRRIWIQLTTDRKRFGILCAMVALGLLLWGRLIVVSNLPRTAVAEPQGGAPAKGGTASPASLARTGCYGLAVPDVRGLRPTHILSS